MSSSGYGNHSAGSSHLGRDAAIGTGALGAGNVAHHHDNKYDNYGTGSQSTGSSHLGRDAAVGAGTLGAGGVAHHHYDKQHDNYSSGNQSTGSSHLGRDAAVGSGALGAGEAAHHHHNKDRDNYGSGNQSTGTSHLGRDAALGAGALGAGEAAHHHLDKERDNYGSNTGRSFPLGGTSNMASGNTYPSGQTGTYPAGTGSTAAGPHSSNLANKADPRVDSDLDGSRGFGNSGTAGRDHHLGRDAAVGAGLGGVAYEADKHHRSHDPASGTGLGSSTATSDPYSTQNTGHGHDGHHDNTGTTGRDHHLGRDAAVGAGVGGAAYEADKQHHNKHHPTGTTSTTGLSDPYSSAGVGSGLGGITHPSSGMRDPTGSGYDQQAATGHHYGRDAGLAGAGGVGAYEAEKHLGGHGHSGTSSYPQDRLAGSGHQPITGTTGSGHAPQDRLAGSGHQPTTTSGTGVSDPYSSQSAGRDHHLGRDAAIGGTGAGAGAYAGHEYSKKEADKAQKEQVKEQKHHEKSLEKEEKKHEKALAHEEKHHDKHHDTHDDGKKHGGLLGFLHRDKTDKDVKEEEAERQRETGALGTHRPGNAEMSAGVGAIGGSRAPEHNSAGYGAHELANQHGSQSGVHNTPISASGNVHDSAISGSGLGSGRTTHDAYGTMEGQNKLHKDPY